MCKGGLFSDGWRTPPPPASGPEATPHCGIGPGWALKLGQGAGMEATQLWGPSREGRHWVSVCQAPGREGGGTGR